MSDIFKQDIETVVNADFIPWEKLNNKTIFITGATGLIGYTLVNALVKAGTEKGLNMNLILLVRDRKKAEERFKNVLDSDGKHIVFIEDSVERIDPGKLDSHQIDFIIHSASNTSSKGFVTNPVETIDTALIGTRNVLEIAKEHKVDGFIYLSSMEVYGYPEKGHKVTEDEIGDLTPLDVRNSYPISKVICESMCVAFAKEYGVPAKIIRLTQTFGPGVNYTDNRIFAYFLRCMNEKRDIVLKTKGDTERSYLYTTDAVTAILTVLLKGENGKAYNAANEDTYCSIAKMAEDVAKEAGIEVLYDIQDEVVNGYPQTIYMDLDTSKLKGIGLEARWGALTRMFNRTIEWIREENETELQGE